MSDHLKFYSRLVRFLFATLVVVSVAIAYRIEPLGSFFFNYVGLALVALPLSMPLVRGSRNRRRRPVSIFVDQRGRPFYYYGEPQTERPTSTRSASPPRFWTLLETPALIAFVLVSLVVTVVPPAMFSGGLPTWIQAGVAGGVLGFYLLPVIDFRLDQRWYPRIHDQSLVVSGGENLVGSQP